MSSPTVPSSDADPPSSAIVMSTRAGLPLLLIWMISTWICLGLGILLLATRHRLHSAEVAFSLGEFGQAFEQSNIELRNDPDSSQALLIAGLSAQQMKQPEIAIRYLRRVPHGRNATATQVLLALGNDAFQHGRAADAEGIFRQILDLDPDHFESRDRLIYLLVLQGRIWEAQQLILPALQSGNVALDQLIAVGSSVAELEDTSTFAKASLATSPNDLLPLLPEARKAYRDHEADRARNLLERIIHSRPEILEAHALLGIVLAEGGDSDAILAWHHRLPTSADEHPGIWYAKGLWAAHTEQREAAVRCFSEALVRQPGHIGANHQMSQVLALLGDEARAVEFGNRARDLVRLENSIRLVSREWKAEHVLQIVQLLESMGRNWEAAAWCHLALADSSTANWPANTLKRLRPGLSSCRTLVAESADPVAGMNRKSYPLPTWQTRAVESQKPDPTNAPDSPVSFENAASAAGVRFTYHNGGSSGDAESMLEFDGGGVAVLDFDGDHWPDLYLTQGGPLPTESLARFESDRLFRNMGNGQFVDVTTAALVNETGYSQGVAFGDVNDDGFPDIYVANIGANSLCLNNGDGTFHDATQTSGTAGAEWTSSCVIADINGDSFPDVYAVNYIGGEELRTRHCFKSDRIRCTPDQYRSEPDRLYLNMGDGRFEDVTDSAGILDPDGRGLGIIAADFDDSHRISLFVGNDMSRNFLFANQTAVRGSAPSFSERALLQGIAVDSRGAPKASMGIAAGDANGDGLFDLFITNFYHESSNLYLQHRDHTFSDATRSANLAENSVQMLGWGTQFLDGELDGAADLIVTNGHVHKPTDASEPYQMSPQYFRNAGRGRFVELPAATLGDFFRGRYLGRALARLDWNRDGLEEVCISHLDVPAALLLNTTRTHGHYVTLKLIGVESDRDAIGATVRVVAGGREWRRQLTAGDGYQASNQRQLVFGLGSLVHIDHVDVSWTSGRRQFISNLMIDREFVVIEGRPGAVEISR